MKIICRLVEQNSNFALDVKDAADNFVITVQDTAEDFDLTDTDDVQIIESPTDPYQGEYAVTPSPHEQTLDTSGKRLYDDLIVRPIPFSKTSNIGGGYTVTIGG